jgi:hypothetical protein
VIESLAIYSPKNLRQQRRCVGYATLTPEHFSTWLERLPDRYRDSFCDAAVRVRLRELATTLNRRFDYRRLHILLRREGIVVNHKKPCSSVRRHDVCAFPKVVPNTRNNFCRTAFQAAASRRRFETERKCVVGSAKISERVTYPKYGRMPVDGWQFRYSKGGLSPSST